MIPEITTRSSSHGPNSLLEYYRLPENLVPADTQSLKGFPIPDDALRNIPEKGTINTGLEAIDYFRLERYAKRSVGKRLGKTAYYSLRPFLPFALRNRLKRLHSRGWEHKKFPHWPVDVTVETIFQQLLMQCIKSSRVQEAPFIWFWPEGYTSCVVVTHDVETTAGRNFCSQLMDLNDRWKIKSSFQLVPEERYTIPAAFLQEVRSRGFEVNIHDLNHDGHLFDSHRKFLRRAKRINRYAKEYGAKGFRAGAMYRNPDWLEAFDFSYDMSFPTVAHLDPQQGGCCTVMPFFVGKMLELPLTTVQDYFLFHALNEYSLELWKQQTEIILQHNGLISFLVHPDYILQERAKSIYEALLAHIGALRCDQNVWIALPSEVDRWWRERSQMKLLKRGDNWSIEGAGSDRARVAHASLDGNALRYTIADRDRVPDILFHPTRAVRVN